MLLTLGLQNFHAYFTTNENLKKSHFLDIKKLSKTQYYFFCDFEMFYDFLWIYNFLCFVIFVNFVNKLFMFCDFLWILWFFINLQFSLFCYFCEFLWILWIFVNFVNFCEFLWIFTLNGNWFDLQNPILNKIPFFNKIYIFTKFTFLQNSHYFNYQKKINKGKIAILPQCDESCFTLKINKILN